MKIDFKDLENKIKNGGLLKKSASFVIKKEAYILSIIFFALLACSGYMWYQYAYNYQWSDARKQEYVSAKSSGTSFNKTKFEKVLENINARQDEYQKTVDNPKDIFRLK